MIVILLFSGGFSLWNSLPDSVKEQLLGVSPIPPRVVSDPATDQEPPNLNGARKIVGRYEEQFDPLFGATISNTLMPITPGYFQLAIPSNFDQTKPHNNQFPYSPGGMILKEVLRDNIYVSARLGGLENVRSLEIFSVSNLHFILDAKQKKFFVWGSEQDQQEWKPIPLNVRVYPNTNTIGIHQQGRRHRFFVNNKYVDEYMTLESVPSGRVGIAIKCYENSGGVASVDSFVVYEFSRN